MHINLKYFSSIVFSAMLFACNSNQEQSSSPNNGAEYQFIEPEDNKSVELAKPCQVDELANFLVGEQSEDFNSYCASDSYKEYSKNVLSQWQELISTKVAPAQTWAQNNISEMYNDTTTLFYPFGGPDMLFAHTFFPKANNYVFFGLENPGTPHDISSLSQSQIKEYLDGMEYNFRYLTKYGFFVASHMQDDFRNKLFNGALHPIIYVLKKLGYTITYYQPIVLSNMGRIQVDNHDSKNVYGFMLKFFAKGDKKERNFMYFRLDASNDGVSPHLEFPYFITSFAKKNCYLKSASYLLQENAFSMMRKIIIDQCDNIVQDESGIAYKEIKKHYNVDLFGTYTRPVKVFSMFAQEDLKQATEQGKTQPLGFKIGYTSQFDQSIIMVARKNMVEKPQEQTSASNANSQDTIYKVQFMVSWKNIPLDDKEFNGIKDIDYYTDQSYYKYTSGNFKNENDCQATLQNVRAKGYKDAFIVRFKNNKRIK